MFLDSVIDCMFCNMYNHPSCLFRQTKSLLYVQITLQLYWLLALSLSNLEFSNFLEIWPNLALTKFLVRFARCRYSCSTFS